MEARDWIELGIFVLGLSGAIISSIRYVDTQISDLKLKILDRSSSVDKELMDKGEYGRAHRDHETRIRAIERWQDHANGRARYYYHGKEEEEGSD